MNENAQDIISPSNVIAKASGVPSIISGAPLSGSCEQHIEKGKCCYAESDRIGAGDAHAGLWRGHSSSLRVVSSSRKVKILNPCLYAIDAPLARMPA